jgi:hypothetical protein
VILRYLVPCAASVKRFRDDYDLAALFAEIERVRGIVFGKSKGI